MIFFYEEYTGKVDKKNQLVTVTKTVEIKEDILETLNSVWEYDFFVYFPIEHIERFLKTYSDDETVWLRGFFNNFIDYFPGSMTRKDIEEYKNVGNEKTLREILREWAKKKRSTKKQQESFIKNGILRSEKMMDQTSSDLVDAVDEAIEACWLDVTEIRNEIIAIENKTFMWEREEFVQKIHRKIWPVYIYLRKQWYSHSDLCS